MKKEASGKKSKLWLWIVLGLVALLAAAAVIVVMFLLPKDDATKVEAAGIELYWNVDREANTDPDTGLSIRQAASDGIYYVRFAHEGKQEEIPVADKKLVNYIDSLDLMGLVLDANGYAVDVKPLTDVVSVIGENMYVQSVNGDTVVANSSIMMNGRKITIKLSEDMGIYNVSGKGEFVGENLKASDLNPMDTISVYGTLVPEDSEEEPVPTHIFVLKKPAESKVYWRADQFYDSSNKVTTRVPDENGAYTIPFWVDGEYVELKCKDQEVVTFIDAPAYYWCHYGLEFDEEGYIVEAIDSAVGSRTLLQCERYDITELGDDGSYVATSLIKNNGAFVQGVVGADCPIWEVSPAAAAEGEPCRKIDSLKMGDRVCIWTDTMGNPVLIYVAHRLVDSPAYWNVTRKWDSTNKQTSRVPNEETGLYEIELLPAGGEKTMYYTDKIEIASKIDQTSDYVVGLRVGEGNMIECVYDMEAIFGYTYLCRGYYVTEASSTVCTFLSAAGSGYSRTGVMAANCVPYNVSAAGTYGEVTTLQFGDLVYACKTPTGEVASAYVTRRYLGEQHLYWNLDRQWNSDTKETKRPLVDGYYVFDLVQDGKIIQAKTASKEIASTIDSYSAPGLYIKIENGIITEMPLDGNYATGGTKWASRTVVAITEDGEVTLRSSSGSETTFTMTEDIKVTNVSGTFEDHKGELTELRVGDYVNVYRDIYCNILSIYIRNRETSHLAWAVDQQYDSTNACTKREPVNGWYEIPLAIDGQVKTYKTKNKAVATAVDYYSTAFGVNLDGNIILSASSVSYVKDVKGLGVSNYVVETVKDENGNVVVVYTLGSADKTGTKETFAITENTKIIDVSPEAKKNGKFGTYTTLKYGDTVRTYVSDEGEVLYLFVTAHFARKGELFSYCDHCGKKVYWNAYTNASTIPSYDTHFYLPSDVELVGKQISLGNTTQDFEMVLDLNGHTLFRDGGRLALVRRGETFSIIDSVGTGVMKTKNNTSNGGVIMLSGGEKEGIGVLNIYGGQITIEESDDPTAYSAQGGIVTNGGGIMNMYGGELKGGIVYGSTSSGGVGGNVRVSDGTFNMYGGKLSGGKAFGGTYEAQKKDADGKKMFDEAGNPIMETLPAAGTGGNIYMTGNKAVVNIYDGVIENGEAARGGNVHVAGGVFTMHKGTISGGVVSQSYGRTSDGRGGNIFNTGEVHILGGTVSDGKIIDGYSAGGNIMSTGLNATVYVSGDAKVTGGIDEDGKNDNIYLMYSNLVVSGGTINVPTEDGTNIYAYGYDAGPSSVVISGGQIGRVKLYGGEADHNGVDTRSTLDILGGTVDQIDASKAGKVFVSGKPVVKNLKLGNGVLLELGAMEKGASVTVDTLGTFTKPSKNAKNYKGYFSALDTAYVVDITANNELKIRHPQSVPGHCDHCSGEADWLAWDGVASNGHFYLTDNIELDEHVKISSSSDFVLDLRGYTVSAKDREATVAGDATYYGGVFYTSGSLSIMDTSEAKTGMITGGKAARGGNIFVDTDASFTLYGGTIAGGIADNEMGGRYAEGEKIEEGVDLVGQLKSATNGRGGNIFSNGQVILIGGAVIDGSAMNGSAYGGNICATGEGGIIMGKGVVISGGKVRDDDDGSNILLMYSKLVMTGGEIINAAKGYNIAMTGTSTAGYSTLQVSGGHIDGTVSAPNAANTIIIGGNPVIDNLKKHDETMIQVGLMAEGAQIKLDVRGVFTTAFASKKAAEAAKGYFVIPAPHAFEIAVTENFELAVQAIKHDTTSMELYCAHCDQTVTFTSWSGYYIAEGGHYYLAEDLTLADETKIEKGLDVYLNLNGHTITAAENKRVFYVDGDLNVMDSSADETGLITGGRATRGGNIYVSSGTFTLYSGTIANGVADNNMGTSTTNGRGGNIFANNDVFLLGGKVIDGSCVDGSNYGGNVMVTGMGAALYVGEGAVVSGGTATTGSDVAVMYSNLVVDGGEIAGNVYTNGTNTGGLSTITINAGTVGGTITLGGGKVNVQTNGEGQEYYVSSGKEYFIGYDEDGAYYGTEPGKNSGKLYLDFGTVLTINGGTIAKINVNNKAFGDTITVSGKPVINEILLTNAKIDATAIESGASVKVDASGVFTTAFADKAAAEAVLDCFTLAQSSLIIAVSDAFELVAEMPPVPTKTIFCQHCGQEVEFSQWTGVAADGHFYLEGPVNLTNAININNGMDVVIDLNGQTVTANNCRAFYITVGATLSIQGEGTITGGVAGVNGRGGNIYASGANLNLFGGTIIGGTANDNNNHEGNNVAVYDGAFTMNGNVVIGNAEDAAKTGHSLYLFNATVNMVKGTITGKILARGSNFALPKDVSVDFLALRSSDLTAVEERDDNAQIIVKATDGTGASLLDVFTSALDNAQAVVGYFKAEKADCEIVVNADNKLQIKEATGGNEPGGNEPGGNEPEGETKTIFCQHCQQEVEFVKMELVDSQSGTDYTLSTGHYFLAQNVELTKQIAFGSNKDVVVDLNGKTITATGCRAFYLSGGATLSIQGEGIITGGTAPGRGGNIYATGADLKLYGGTIVGGTATLSSTNDGNNVTVFGGAFVMNGNVTIGDADKEGHSLYLFNTTSVEMVKGTVVGKARLRSANFELKKDVTFDLLALQTTMITAVEERTGDKILIKVTNNDGSFLFSDPNNTENPNQGLFTDALTNAATALTYFEAAGTDRGIIVNAENKLEVIEDTTGGNPGGDPGTEPEPTPETVFCPHCATEIVWTEWAGQTESGHYYLTADVELTAKYAITGADKDVVIDLRGFDITANGATHVFDIRDGAILSVCDTAGDDVEDGVISGANSPEGSGGNVYVYHNGATFNLYGGTITGGSALQRGGNIYVTSGGICNIYGGSVIGGTITDAANMGANIFVMQGALNILGNAYIANEVDGDGEAVYVQGTSTMAATFTMTAGVIDGELVIRGVVPTAEISGTAVVAEVTLKNGALVTKLGAFQEGAGVLFNATEGALTAAGAIAEADMAYIDTVANDKVIILNADNALEAIDACVCGCKTPVADVEWIDANAYMAALAQKETNPTVIEESVHLKLSADLNITEIFGGKKQISIGGNNDIVLNVVIDLNGYTWSSAYRMYNYKNCTLTILDSSEAQTGTMTASGRSNEAHGGVFINNGTLNILSGTFTQPADGSIVHKGGVIYNSGGTVNMYGGTIIGGQTNINKTGTLGGLGGNVHIYSGTFNMYGGTIEGGIAKESNGKGGNVYVRTGEFNFFGGVIKNGVAAEGAEYYTEENGQFNELGGVIGEILYCPCGCGAKAEEIVWVDPTSLTTATAKLTESVHIKLNADFDVTTHYGAVKQIYVGDSGVQDVAVVIDLNGFTWSSNDRIYIVEGCTLTILDSSEAGTGVATSTGSGAKSGRLIANYGTFNLISGTLTMTAPTEDTNKVPAGGVVYQSKGVFNMYGGKIINGLAVDKEDGTPGKGGNVSINSGAFNMYGGEISGGEATQGTNIFLSKTAVFTQEGGTIADQENTVYQAQ